MRETSVKGRILSSDEDGSIQLYCICRSSSANRFMIGCDECEEWYHGDCVKITEGSSKLIRKYYCPPCRERNPKLRVKYKKEESGDRKRKSSPPPTPTPPSSSSRGGTKKSRDDDPWVPKRKRSPEPASEEINYYFPEGPRQCIANCVNTARSGSKYCSDQCGINLASMRIYQTLPDRIREWNLTPCVAEKNNLKELESIHEQQDAAKKRLEELGEEFRELEELIEKGKKLSIVEKDDDEEDSGEMTIHCVTCGQSVTASTAIRHMERCYNRMESQTSFASKFKTQIFDRRMFCDFYNPKEESYCKRLQVLCPEHNRDPIPADNEVCGCPIEDKLFSKNTADFCRLAKKRCQQHFSWEKLRRAVIDMERVRQWMKVDELFEMERQVRAAMTSRAGVLGLMLHSTYNHELEERWQAQRVAAVAAQQRKMNKIK